MGAVHLEYAWPLEGSWKKAEKTDDELVPPVDELDIVPDELYGVKAIFLVNVFFFACRLHQ